MRHSWLVLLLVLFAAASMPFFALLAVFGSTVYILAMGAYLVVDHRRVKRLHSQWPYVR